MDGLGNPLFGMDVKYTADANPFYPLQVKTTIDKKVQRAMEDVLADQRVSQSVHMIQQFCILFRQQEFIKCPLHAEGADFRADGEALFIGIFASEGSGWLKFNCFLPNPFLNGM